MATDPFSQRTEALYQKDGTLYTHESSLSGLVPLSTLPEDTRTLFKAPAESESASEPFILTMPATIFHAQGGGQPSDTGTIVSKKEKDGKEEEKEEVTFHVHQVRRIHPTIYHMGVFTPATSRFATPNPTLRQKINAQTRTLHSRLHTAGHALALAINILKSDTSSNQNHGLPPTLLDGKASHYPGAAFVEFSGLIPSTAKPFIQAAVDALISQNADLPVSIHFWDEERVRRECTGGEFLGEGEVKGDEVDGVRVVRFGSVGAYPCGGTHVEKLGDVGRVVVRGVKRQKGVSKVSYEVVDA